MAIDNDKKYLLKDLVLNHETSCSVDEAIGMMLGILKGANWYLDVDHENSRTEYERETGNEPDDGFELRGCLASMRNQLQWAYWDAEEAKEPLEQHLVAIEEFDTNYMKKAKVYLCLVEDELAKGNQSHIRTIANEYGVKRITLASLDEWWAAKQKLNHLEQSIFQDMQHNVPPKQDIPKEDKGLSPTLTKSFYIAFVCLLKAFIAKNSSGKYGKVEKLVVDGVEKVIVKSVNVQALADCLYLQSGQGSETIKSRIEEAIKDVAKQHPDIFEKPVEVKK